MHTYLARFCLSTVHFAWRVCLGRVWAFEKEVIYRGRMTQGLWKKINEIPPYTQMFSLDDAVSQGNPKKVEGCIILVDYFSQAATPKTFITWSADLGITSKKHLRDSPSVAKYCLCFYWYVVLNGCTCPCKVTQELIFCGACNSWSILRCKDACPPFPKFPFFPPTSSLSLLLSVPIKGQWINLLYFHVTSSVFDFCLLEIGHGVNIESFDQSCQE